MQLPTGTGKSLVIADITNKLREKNGRIWVVTHVQELITQNVQALDRLAGLDGVGVVCSGLGKDEFGSSVTYGSVQTLYRRVGSVNGSAPHAIIIDEAHMVPPGDESVMYRDLLQAFPKARRIGMTATPWRMDGGIIYGDQKDQWFSELCYQKTPIEMVEAGWLSPLKGVTAEAQIDLAGVHKIAGDYSQKEVDDRVTQEWATNLVNSVKILAKGRKHLLVFAPTIRTANLIAEIFCSKGEKALSISSEDDERSDKINLWTAGEARIMVNVGILTTGFDFPALDCIVSVRPTESSSLWIQQMGRGMRIAAGKKDCLVLDYAGNLKRLGGVGMTEDTYIERAGALTEVSGQPEQRSKRGGKLAGKGLALIDPMSGAAKDVTVSVNSVKFIVLASRKQPGKSMVMVSYSCQTEEGYPIDVSDFLCVEYSGWARSKAESWFARRGSKAPFSARAAREECWGLPIPRKIVVRKNGAYINVQSEQF